MWLSRVFGVKCFIPLVFLGFGQELLAQKVCVPSDLLRVFAPSGLRIRIKPSVEGKIVATVPFDSLILACPELFGGFKTEEVEGHWRFVQYKKYEGFLFDGFTKAFDLEPEISIETTDSSNTGIFEITDTILRQKNWKLDSVKNIERVDTLSKITTLNYHNFKVLAEVYNYCGNVNQIDPSLNWYGLYTDEQAPPSYKLKRVNLKVVLSQSRTSENLEFDIETGEVEKSIFLVGTNLPLERYKDIKENPPQSVSLPIGLMPGQLANLPVYGIENRLSIRLTALGNINSVEGCLAIEAYRLKAQMGEQVQDLAAVLNLENRCGSPEIIWIGDLNEDRIPDVLIAERSLIQSRFTLLLSHNQNEGIWRIADIFNIETCN